MASHSKTNGEPLCNSMVKQDEHFVPNLFFAIIDILVFVCGYFKLIVLCAVLFLFIYILYKSYWSPVFYSKELTDVGYDHLPKKNRSRYITRAQNTRKIGSVLPPPYPNGWFVVAESRDLDIGDVLPVDALGLNLCVYRGTNGTAQIIDAYCPHLGANLAVGGTVSGNCVECPFHQWKFGPDGICVRIPGMETVPSGISIKSYHSTEVDGSIWIWYHVDGEPPQWTLKDSEKVKNWGYRGRNEFLVNAHVQEIPENGADVAHLNVVHNISTISEIAVKYPFLKHVIGHHVWNAVWAKGDNHLAEIKISHKYVIMTANIFPLEIVVRQIGPGQVCMSFNSRLGPVMILQSVTPLGPLLQKVVHRVYTPCYNAPLGAIMVLMEAFQFQRDIAIWNNKRYVNTPAYVKSDKTIRRFRHWFSQFYSENSVPLREAMQKSLEW